MTTVGYGDTFPLSAVGKVIGGITAVSGVLVLAFPIAIFGSNFQASYTHIHAKIK
jgi:hypothetical protein